MLRGFRIFERLKQRQELVRQGLRDGFGIHDAQFTADPVLRLAPDRGRGNTFFACAHESASLG
jgi:hypothetical protein